MTGDRPRRGVGKSRALPGGDPTGAARRRLAAVPASRGPVAARRDAPTGTGSARQVAVDGECYPVHVQQWTAKAGGREQS